MSLGCFLRRNLRQKVSFTGYECLNFSKTLEATDTNEKESAIERVLHEVFPKHEEDLNAEAHRDTDAASRQVFHRKKSGNSNNITDTQKDNQFIHSFCCLWRLFHNVTKQMRCKDPSTPGVEHLILTNSEKTAGTSVLAGAYSFQQIAQLHFIFTP